MALDSFWFWPLDSSVGEEKWGGVVKGAATKAAAVLSRSTSGPEAAEEFVQIVMHKDIIYSGACGSVVGAVLSGYLRRKKPESVRNRSLQLSWVLDTALMIVDCFPGCMF